MSEHPHKARIGIFWHGGEVWHGGQIYKENVARILKGCDRIEPVIVAKDADEISRIGGEFSSLESISIESSREWVFAAFHAKQEERQRLQTERQAVLAERRAAAKRKKFWQRSPEFSDLPPLPGPPERPMQEDVLRDLVSRHRLDLLFPLPSVAADDIPGVGWIADFQHRYLPEFFPEEEYQLREERLGLIAGQREVLLSSEVCRAHFRELYPKSRARLSVWRFCTRVPEATLTADPEGVRLRYHLPEDFLLVSNQFWKHKDHRLVIEALGLLAAEGKRPVLVFTGSLSDGRGSAHIDALLQSIQEQGLHGQVRILGFLSRADQIALMRRALAVIQPSRFEGWSTVVEDCRSLGQRLVLSDLAVHREQDPPNAAFFPVGNAGALAQAVASILTEPQGKWENGRAGRETTALERMKKVESEAEEGLVSVLLGAVERWREGGAATTPA